MPGWRRTRTARASWSFAVVHAQTLGSWLLLAVLTMLRLRRTAALTATALFVSLAYTTTFGFYWDDFDTVSVVARAVAGLEVAALTASPEPARAMRILAWKHYAPALAVPVALAAVFQRLWPDHYALASPRAKRVASLLALPAYYLAVESLVPPSLSGLSHGGAPGWPGLLQIALILLPLVVLLWLALRAALRAVRHVPASGQQS